MNRDSACNLGLSLLVPFSADKKLDYAKLGEAAVRYGLNYVETNCSDIAMWAPAPVAEAIREAATVTVRGINEKLRAEFAAEQNEERGRVQLLEYCEKLMVGREGEVAHYNFSPQFCTPTIKENLNEIRVLLQLQMSKREMLQALMGRLMATCASVPFGSHHAYASVPGDHLLEPNTMDMEM